MKITYMIMITIMNANNDDDHLCKDDRYANITIIATKLKSQR